PLPCSHPDPICVTNSTPPPHSIRGPPVNPKSAVMAERLRQINPRCQVLARQEFYSAEASDGLLAGAPDLVVDAIDNLAAKTHLIATCRARQLPIVVSGGASGRMDPTQIRIADLNNAESVPFLATTRKLLRRNHDFPQHPNDPWGVSTVYSPVPAPAPLDHSYDDGLCYRCDCLHDYIRLHRSLHRTGLDGPPPP